MIKRNLWRAFVSSILILHPILVGLLVWDSVPNSLIANLGIAGIDQVDSKTFVVFGFPAIVLMVHWLFLGLSSMDSGRKKPSKTKQRIMFWAMPTLSLAIQSYTLNAAFGRNSFKELLLPFFLGIFFLVMGHIIPLLEKDSKIGIRLSWTLRSRRNWFKTHRFTGKLWVAGGFIMLIATLMPTTWMFAVMILNLLVMVVAPIFFSYHVYKAHKAKGITYRRLHDTKNPNIYLGIVLIVLAVVLAGVTILMIGGDVNYTFNDSHLSVAPSYSDGFAVSYSQIDEVLFYSTFDKGTCQSGFASARLAVGTYKNGEFGSYTLYGYAGNTGAVVLRVNDQFVALTGKDLPATMDLYDTLTAYVKTP